MRLITRVGRSRIASQPGEETGVEPYEALASLTDADWLRLEKVAQYQVYRYASINPQEVLNEAVLRVLSGDRKCRPGLEFLQFLRGAIRSIADEFRKKEKEAIGAGEIAIESYAPDRRDYQDTADSSNPLESQLRDKELVERIWELFSDDEDVQALLFGAEEGMTGVEIQRKFNFTTNEYGAARKRLERKLASYLKEGRV